MLTPAIVAYGLPVVVVMCLVFVASIVVLVLDFRRYSRSVDKLDAAARRRSMNRHPAGRHGRQLFPTADDRPTVQLPPVRGHRPRHP